MTDTRKEFEQWLKTQDDYAPPMPYETWQACQQLNNPRIADLEATIRNMAAVIAKKDEALQIAIEYQEEACQYFHDAMAGYKEHAHQRYRDDLKETKEALDLTADGVKLVEVDPADYDAMYMLSEGLKLYTIKQKG